jgi:hypothetical protein
MSGVSTEETAVSYVSEAVRISAWLKANAKHMGNPWEVDQMLRAAVVIKLLSEELARRDALLERVQRD